MDLTTVGEPLSSVEASLLFTSVVGKGGGHWATLKVKQKRNFCTGESGDTKVDVKIVLTDSH